MMYFHIIKTLILAIILLLLLISAIRDFKQGDVQGKLHGFWALNGVGFIAYDIKGTINCIIENL